MKLAFCLYHYFPYGGLERDFLRIATAIHARGHAIHIWTTHWDGPEPDFATVHQLRPKGWRNHRKLHSFGNQMLAACQQHHIDAIIGFNKIPGIDIYYAADACFKNRLDQRTTLLKWLPRYRYYQLAERQLFTAAKSHIITISPIEKNRYQQHYHTPDARMHALGPGLSTDRQYPSNAPAIRQRLRHAHLPHRQTISLLMVGSHFKTKGLSRTLYAMAHAIAKGHTQLHLWVIGQGEVKTYRALATKLGIAQHIDFLGARDDVPEFMLAADILLQPSRVENTGTTIIEAMNAGCPVLATGACGFSPYISDADAGLVIPEPFSQSRMNAALLRMLEAGHTQRLQWGQQGHQYAQQMDLFSFEQRAATLIETLLGGA